jgi:putative ABC transport system ATP-binding protein
VFQRYNLLPTLSAQGNLDIAREIFRNGRSHDDHTKEILELLGLDHKTRHKPSEMSGGNSKRVAIARRHQPTGDSSGGRTTGNLDSENSQAVLSLLQGTESNPEPVYHYDYP